MVLTVPYAMTDSRVVEDETNNVLGISSGVYAANRIFLGKSGGKDKNPQGKACFHPVDFFLTGAYTLDDTRSQRPTRTQSVETRQACSRYRGQGDNVPLSGVRGLKASRRSL